MMRNLKSVSVCAKTLSTASRRYFSPLCTANRTQTQGGEVFIYGDRRPFRTAAVKMGQPPRLTPFALHRITMAKYRKWTNDSFNPKHDYERIDRNVD
jgi:hypothetical protein